MREYSYTNEISFFEKIRNRFRFFKPGENEIMSYRFVSNLFIEQDKFSIEISNYQAI